MTYHISPKTGRPNLCRAKTKCPFGDLERDHYATADDARAAYEASMKAEEVAPAQQKPDASRDEVYYTMRDDAVRELTRINQELLALDDQIRDANWLKREKLKEMRSWDEPYREAADAVEANAIKATLQTLSNEVDALTDNADALIGARSKLFAEAATHRVTRSAAERTIHNERLKDPQAGVVTVSTSDLSRNFAVQLARAATTMSGHEAVVDARETKDGAVDIKMSSWPRAQEAKEAFDRRGFLTTLGGNSAGQWLRVRPMPTETVSTGSLAWSPEDNMFTVEASELRQPMPKFLKSAKSDQVIELRDPVVAMDAENDVLYWEAAPLDPQMKWTVRVYND